MLFGLAANYLPLTIHVLTLWPPGRLEPELRDVDLGAELRHYTRASLGACPVPDRGARTRPGTPSGGLGAAGDGRALRR